MGTTSALPVSVTDNDNEPTSDETTTNNLLNSKYSDILVSVPVRNTPDPVPDMATVISHDDDHLRDKIIVDGYIQLYSHQYGIDIPSVLMNLCLLYYTSNNQWTITPTENSVKTPFVTTLQYNNSLLFGTDITTMVYLKFGIHGKYLSYLEIKMDTKISEKCINLNNFDPWKQGQLFCHIRCEELNYDRSFVKNMHYYDVEQAYVFSTVPTEPITFHFCFKIVPSQYGQEMIPTLDLYPLLYKTFKWKFDQNLSNKILTSTDDRIFYSENFYNKGCYVLSIVNKRDGIININLNVFLIELKVIVLSNPYRYNQNLLEGVMKIYCTDNQLYTKKLVSNTLYTTIKINKKLGIKLITFAFSV